MSNTTIPGAYLVGHCHCQALRLTFAATTPPAEWTPRTCTCEFCRRHAPAYVSDPEGRIALRVDEPDLLQRYRFGTETADFLICRRCGTLLGATCEIQNVQRMLLNARVLVGPAADTVLNLPAVPCSFDGESIPQRTARRAATWTPCSLRSRD